MKKLVILGVTGVDLVSVVDKYPEEEAKVTGQSHGIYGGGNAGNVAATVVRLQQDIPEGLPLTKVDVKLISKVGTDLYGKLAVDLLAEDNVSCEHLINYPGKSGFGLVIVSKEENSRTCIFHRMPSTLMPEELNLQIISAADLLFLDSRYPEAAIAAAKYATDHSVPIYLDLERKREGMEELLSCCNYLNTPKHFPLSYSNTSDVLEGIQSILDKHEQIRWCITTLGKCGQVLLTRETAPVDLPTISSIEELENRNAAQFNYKGHLLFFGTVHPIDNVVDTTGCGDSFVGACLFGFLQDWPLPKLLNFGSVVAALKTQKLGARTAIPTLSAAWPHIKSNNN